MEVISNSTSLCLGNQHCLQFVQNLMSNVPETTSLTLGVISEIVSMVAEIPQLITNYKEKSAEGLSVTFLLTGIIGDLFNLFGCLLEPTILPTQLYTAVLYTIISLLVCSQAIYYGHIYPLLKYKRQFKIDSLKEAGQNMSGVENAKDANPITVNYLSLPIPLPALTDENIVESQPYNQSARYLSTSHTSSHNLNPLEEPLLTSSVLTQSAPHLKIKNTLCLVSALTFLGALNLLHSPDTSYNSLVSKPRHEFVIYVGRKLFQVSGYQLPENDVEGDSHIGAYLGWAMALLYIGGRLPQIYLNMRKGSFEGVNPLMFLLAVVGNSTYVASILVRSLDWSRIGPNLPWLVESGGCTLLDCFIMMQYLYFRYWKSLESKYKYQSLS